MLTLRILTPPMEKPDPPSDTPGASKQVVLTPTSQGFLGDQIVSYKNGTWLIWTNLGFSLVRFRGAKVNNTSRCVSFRIFHDSRPNPESLRRPPKDITENSCNMRCQNFGAQPCASLGCVPKIYGLPETIPASLHLKIGPFSTPQKETRKSSKHPFLR